MASYIHARISSSIWANPPKTPPTVQTSPMGNPTSQHYLYWLPSYLSFLQTSLRWNEFHRVILPSLRCLSAKLIHSQRPITSAARGKLCKK